MIVLKIQIALVALRPQLFSWHEVTYILVELYLLAREWIYERQNELEESPYKPRYYVSLVTRL